MYTAALGEIELSISRANFITWFKNTALESIEGDCAVIRTPNGFAKSWIETKCADIVVRALKKHAPNVTRIRCNLVAAPPRSVDAVRVGAPSTLPSKPKRPTLRPTSSTPTTPPITTPRTKPTPQTNTYLNTRYTFDNFIVGSHNELAHAAGRTVAATPGSAYNPLFIYGDVGLGKTHLLQAIGNAIVKNDPTKRVLYTSSERFTSELIDAIHNNTISDFKRLYREIDLLIIDDVQFLAGKEKTQDEFFHIFNHLYQQNKQIIISSDRPPHEIATLEDRLRSRFEGGMIADISPPDFETRVAILQKKADEKDLILPEDAAQFIAKHVAQNVRELEGALNKIAALCTFHNRIPSRAVVEEILAPHVTRNTPANTASSVLELVAEHFGVSPDDLRGTSRKKAIAGARHAAMYLLREELNLSFPEIGSQLGGRDHSTVMHGYRKVRKNSTQDATLRSDLDTLRKKLRNL